MLTSVHFDYDSPIKTNEVRNIISKRYLTQQLETYEAAVARQPPHFGFCIGGFVPHPPRGTLNSAADRAKPGNTRVWLGEGTGASGLF